MHDDRLVKKSRFVILNEANDLSTRYIMRFFADAQNDILII